MAISSPSLFAQEAAVKSTTTTTIPNTTIPLKMLTSNSSHPQTSPTLSKETDIPSMTSSDSDFNSAHDIDQTVEFAGDVNTNNDIPTREVLRRIQDLTVLDQDGKSLPFRHIYEGRNVARRVLVIFIRHFFCGNCQEYVRTLTSSITPTSLLSLSTPTFIAVIGCGSPKLIPMYAAATSCPFPIYADPTKKLYSELGMLRTLNLGIKRPEYQRKGLLTMAVQSVVQGVRELGKGKAFNGGAWRGGDMQQVGGEFLFESLDTDSPVVSPDGDHKSNENDGYGFSRDIKDGLGTKRDEKGQGQEKIITWCHRMRNTRDHAELPELREVLGLDGMGVGGRNRKRWTRALGERKGTGLSSHTVGGRNKSLSPERNGVVA